MGLFDRFKKNDKKEKIVMLAKITITTIVIIKEIKVTPFFIIHPPLFYFSNGPYTDEES